MSALLFLWTTAPARAATPTPTVSAPEKRLQSLFARLVKAADLPVDASLRYSAQSRSCGAATLYANTDLNDTQDPIVLVTPDIFVAGNTDDHLAFVLAHEIGHIKLEHADKQTSTLRNYYWPWLKVRSRPKTGDPYIIALVQRLEQSRRQGDAAQAAGLHADLRAIFMEEYGDRIDAAQRPLEEAADRYAADLMALVGMRPVGSEAVQKVMNNCNWLNIDTQSHGSVWKRSESIFFQDLSRR